MSNTFLILKDANGRTIRVRAEHITSYAEEGRFTTMNINGFNVDVEHTVEEIDDALTQSLFSFKKV